MRVGCGGSRWVPQASGCTTQCKPTKESGGSLLKVAWYIDSFCVLLQSQADRPSRTTTTTMVVSHILSPVKGVDETAPDSKPIKSEGCVENSMQAALLPQYANQNELRKSLRQALHFYVFLQWTVALLTPSVLSQMASDISVCCRWSKQ